MNVAAAGGAASAEARSVSVPRPRAARVHVGVALIIVAAVLVTFWPVLRADFVLWDDDLNVTDNVRYRGLSTRHLGWMFTTMHGGHYQPLTWVSLALDHLVWGMDARGYHATNLALHAANAVLSYGIILGLLRSGAAAAGSGARDVAAALVGALGFALHPLRVEPVAWISERRDVLSASFYLLAVLAYVRAMQVQRAGWRLLSLAACALSLLSKAWAVTLPAVLLVLDAHPFRRLPAGGARVVWEKWPWVGLAAVGSALAFAAQRQVEAMRTLEQHGVVERLVQAAYGLCFYVWKTIVPRGLSPLYLLEDVLDPSRGRYVLAVLAVGIAGVVLLRWGNRRPWALAAAVATVAILSPVLGLVQTGPQIAADRYTYLASLPACVLAAAYVRRTPHRLVAGGLAVALLAGLATRQALVWRNSRALWDQALRVDATNYVAWTNRGWARQLAGDVRGATEDASEAIRLDPAYALAWINRGVARQGSGDRGGAIADYSEALRVSPRSGDAAYNRGTVWHARGDLANATRDYELAMRLRPRDPRPPNNRGQVREAQGDLAGAIADYARALELAPPDWPGRAVIEENLAAARRRSTY